MIDRLNVLLGKFSSLNIVYLTIFFRIAARIHLLNLVDMIFNYLLASFRMRC